MILSIIAIANFSGDDGDLGQQESVISISEELEQSMEQSLAEQNKSAKALKDDIHKKERDLIESKKREQALIESKKALEEQLQSKSDEVNKHINTLSDKEKKLAEAKKRELEKQKQIEKEEKRVAAQNQKISNLNKDLDRKKREIDAKLKEITLANEKAQALKDLKNTLNKQISEEKNRMKNKDSQLEKTIGESKKYREQTQQQLEEIANLKVQLQKMKSHNEKQVLSNENTQKQLLSLRAEKIQTQELLKKIETVGLNNQQIEKSVREIIKQSNNKIETKIGESKNDLIVKIDKAINENQPQSIHQIYTEYQNNKVTLLFEAKEKGIFGTKNIKKETDSIIFSYLKKDYALLHFKNSPLNWHALDKFSSFSISIKGSSQAITQLHALKSDPRIILAECASKHSSSYKRNEQITKFNNAALINPKNNSYGEFPIQLKKKGNTILIPSSISTRLFGKLSPSAGSFVFSLNGELIGLTVQQGKCVSLNSIHFSESFAVKDLNNKSSVEKVNRWQNRINELN
jgi:myosin heavy subunit